MVCLVCGCAGGERLIERRSMMFVPWSSRLQAVGWLSPGCGSEEEKLGNECAVQLDSGH